MGNHWIIIFYYIIIRLILNIFLKHCIYVTRKTSNLNFGYQNFGYQIWFCTRLFNRQGFVFVPFSVARGMILALGLRSQGYACENLGRTPRQFFGVPPPPTPQLFWYWQPQIVALRFGSQMWSRSDPTLYVAVLIKQCGRFDQSKRVGVAFQVLTVLECVRFDWLKWFAFEQLNNFRRVSNNLWSFKYKPDQIPASETLPHLTK